MSATVNHGHRLARPVTSTFTWLDYSERDRRRALDVIDLFDQPATLDELGIGTIRDGFADLLFPGTSTIQTRARYFLFIPWIHLRLEERQVASATAADAARREEGLLMEAIRKSPDSAGLVGGERGEQVKRLAASVYWGGLGVWRIRLFDGSQGQYFQSLDHLYRQRRSVTDEDAPPAATWHPHLPPPPAGFPAGSSFALERQEALYLQDRIRTATAGSLLSWIVDSGDLPAVRFAWEIREVAAMRPALRSAILHAQNFSESHRGAALLYNLMLADALGAEDLRSRYRQALIDWAGGVEMRRAELVSWDPRELWRLLESSGTRVPTLTRIFVESWLAILRGISDWRFVADHESARRLLERRELDLKRERARLRNRRYLEMWSGNSGADPLDFRWGITRQLLEDVFEALRGNGHAFHP